MAEMTVQDLGLVTVAEASEIAGVPQSTVRQWVRRHEIPTERDRRGGLLLSERALLEVERSTRRQPRGRPRDG